jgi:hypothetical protein
MASLDNGMQLLNVGSYTQLILKGAILVTAVGLDMLGLLCAFAPLRETYSLVSINLTQRRKGAKKTG